MKSRIGFAFLLLALAHCLNARSADLLDGTPRLKASGEGVEIAFDVKAFTDVALEIVDAQGQVVRHLGAGLLGPNAPAPFQKDSKSQVVVWDGKDNQGCPVASKSGLRILVRAGLKPAFERTFGASGQTLGVVKGLAVDGEGHLYVTSKSMPITYREHTFTRVYDREGRYLRTIVPFPANLPAERLQGIRFADVPEGRRVPVISPISERDFHGGLHVDHHQPLILSGEGKLVFPVRGRGLATIGLDGSVGTDFAGPAVAKREEPYQYGVHPRIFLAASPDGRFVYAGGVVRSYNSPAPGGGGVEAFDNCVYRIDRSSQDGAAPFIGEKFNKDGMLANPLGVDVDAEGNLYVCDYGHDRIAVFDAQGKLLHQLAIERPIQVGVHPSGKIYVYTAERIPEGANLNGTRLTHKVVRLAGKGDATVEAEIAWPNLSAWSRPCFVLDKTAAKPVVWFGSLSGNGNWFWYRGDIRKVVDHGDAFEDLGDVITGKAEDPDLGRSHKNILVDPETEEVWWDYFIFDGNSGELLRKFQPKHYGTGIQLGKPGKFVGEPRLGPNDSIVFWGGKGGVARYKRDGKPYPFSATGSHSIQIPGFKGTAGRNFSRGVHVDEQGNIYIVGSLATERATYKNTGVVRKILESGEIAADLTEVEISVGGLAVDRKGAIFMGVHVKDLGQRLPAHWEGFFKAYPNEKAQHEYELATGSVVKFSPTGGAIRLDPAGEAFQTSERFFRETPRFSAQGVAWSKFVYPIAMAHSGKCNCEVADFEVDGHNRLFVPDPLTYSVWVFDENGNTVARFGEYGNVDSAGPGSKVPAPEIPLAYAFRLAVSDKAVYVNDSHAQRVVKVRLDYRETARLDLASAP